MSEWPIVALATGSAIAGGAVTWWFTRPHHAWQAVQRSSERQATELATMTRILLLENNDQDLLQERREVYVRFCEAAGVITGQRTSGGKTVSQHADLLRALSAVELLGPASVTKAALEFIELARTEPPSDDLERAQQRFIDVAQDALHAAPPESGRRRN